MQTRKKASGKTSKELVSPKVPRHQKKLSQNVEVQTKKAADLITSSVRKQKSGASLLKKNDNHDGAQYLDKRLQLEDYDAPVVCLEQDMRSADTNKIHDDESASQAEMLFSPAFHLSKDVDSAVENFKFHHYDDSDEKNMQFEYVSSHGLQEELHLVNGLTTVGGCGLSSEASTVCISMTNENFECVDEYSHEHVTTEVDKVEYEELDEFDPYLFIKNLPELSTVVPTFRPSLLPKKTRRCPSTTLVLDLDETLVHSMLEPCQDADFTFHVKFNQENHTVYVRCRPYLRDFMERVSGLFEIIIFTASQSIYADQLLNVLDPKRKVFRHRVFRDSCVFVDGNYLKDLSVLGRDLSRVMIVDNSPQAFGFQVDNGIPIESWFDDPYDKELLTLLPFLESLIGVDDVRPLIAKKFNLGAKVAAAICPYRSDSGDLCER
ncbi:hypothetical protein Leryth_017988 [Lithospermum erythrorhizon]|nr:hypothetical protein Leryth_017988 [Lithospermum erythrorhizon]